MSHSCLVLVWACLKRNRGLPDEEHQAKYPGKSSNLENNSKPTDYK